MNEILRAALVLLLLISAGCQPTEPVALNPVSEDELAAFDRQLQPPPGRNRFNDPSVIVASHSVEASPASMSPGQETGLRIESSPEDVCRRFLMSLQTGDREAARQLLTPAAQVETTRANLELDAPGDEDTVFTLMAARYATLEKLVAEVDCLFQRRDGLGESVKLTWMMRRLPNGWKIFGMLIDMGSGELDLLSFENALDLIRIQQSVSEDSPTDQATASGADLR